MDKIIDLNAYPVRNLLKLLLKDKTTKQNIIFATSAYSTDGNPIKETDQMTETILRGFNSCEIQPRVLKSQEQQQERTKAKAEVFTPCWICNKMNNHCDEEWFGRSGIFNIELENGWTVTNSPVPFEHEGDWMKYIDSKRLEITCGEAPYIVSRYDAATGELIEIGKRIGILDRKLRVVNENTDNEADWFKWVLRAYQSVYGYEFQGDNLLIARINLLVTFVDYIIYYCIAFIVSEIVLYVYFLPSVIAIENNHTNTYFIYVFNLLLGITVIGWFAALIFALQSKEG